MGFWSSVGYDRTYLEKITVFWVLQNVPPKKKKKQATKV
jgi:hypothetical protein